MMQLLLCRSIWFAPVFAVLPHGRHVSSHCAQRAAESIWREVNSLRTSAGTEAASPQSMLGTSLGCDMSLSHCGKG